MPAPPQTPTLKKRHSKTVSQKTGASAIESPRSIPPPATPPSDAKVDVDQDTLTNLALTIEESSPPPVLRPGETKEDLFPQEVNPEEQSSSHESYACKGSLDDEEFSTYSDSGAVSILQEQDTEQPKNGLKAEPSSPASGDCDLKVAERIAKTRGIPPAMTSDQVRPFLELYGYDVTTSAIDHSCWGKPPDLQPKVQIDLTSHIEFGDHTQYELICKVLSSNSDETSNISWRTLRRLKHIRDGLHSVIKKSLGSKYKHYFGLTAFAHHAAPSGTTSRLRAWFNSVAGCINAGVLEPSIVAMTFRLLDGPGTPLYTQGKSSFITSEAISHLPLTAAMFGSKNSVDLPRAGLRKIDGSPMFPQKLSSDMLENISYVDMVFQVDGQEHRIRATARPLGLGFSQRSGECLKIDKVNPHSHAAELGLQVGWEVKSVGGEDFSAKTCREAQNIITQRISKLPFA